MRLVVPLAGALLLTGASGRALAQRSEQAALSDYERGAFVAAAYGSRGELAVQVLAQAGRGDALLKSLEQLGAEVTFVDTNVGYAAALVPKAKVLDVLDLPDVADAFTLTESRSFPIGYAYRPDEEYVPLSERKPAPVPPIRLPVSHVGKALPPDGPYFAAEETGLTAFWKEHPQGDGRGVRVAVVDEGVDLLHPALEAAMGVGGNIVPKYADIMVQMDPDKSSNWVQFGEPIQTVTGRFDGAGRTWVAPSDGVYRFGIYSRTFFLGGWGPDARRKKVSLSVGVIWNEGSNRVWVDTDGDGDFRNQRALGDYSQTHDMDWFGQKDGEDDNRIPFGVKINTIKRAAYLSIAVNGHGTLVSGPLAANRLTGGLFDGAAPNAQLIDVIETPVWPAVISAFARSDVDVVNRSGGLGRASEESGDVWDDFNRHVLERVVAVYNKPVAAYGGAQNTFSVGDYASAEMLRRNRQTSPPYVDYINGGVFFFRSDGFVNVIIGPSAQLGTESRYMPQSFVSADGQRYTDQGKRLSFAPPGYMIGANPSPTIPVISGVIADLISEAKREHIRYDGMRLTQATFIGARRIDSLPTDLQGFGVVNAAGAWNQLAAMTRGDDPNNPVLTSFTAARIENGRSEPVNGFFADEPESEGTLAEELLITRHGGYEGGRAYTFSVRANDGTYKLVYKNATLVRDQPAHVRFIAQLTPGLHVAFLQLKDAEAGVVMHEIPLSVRVPAVPQMLAPWIERYQQIIPVRRWQRLYVRFNSDTQAARYVMRIPYLGMQGLTVNLPGHPSIDNVEPTGEPLDVAHHVGPMQNIEVVSANAGAETKTILWSNRGGSEYENPSDPPAPTVPISSELRVEKFAVAFGKEAGSRVQVTNKQAQIEGHVVFYDAKMRSREVAGSGSHADAALACTLPAGVSQWRVSVSSASATNGPVDAFLLNDTDNGTVTVVDQKPVKADGATLVADGPPAGNWKIVIRHRERGRDSVSYRIREAWLFPSGAGAPTPAAADQDAKHASGATWSVVVPDKRSDAQYAAFIIAGKPFRILDESGVEPEKYASASQPSTSDMRIAMTPLTSGAP